MKLAVSGTLFDGSRYEPLAPVLDGARIAGFEAPDPGAPPFFAIPGFRNAHVHLDLSDVSGVPRADRGFASWVLDLLRTRGPFDPAQLQRAAGRGARAALASGTTAVVDIDSSGAAASAVSAAGLKGLACREMLGGRNADEFHADVASWIERFESFAPRGRLRPGVSPHAPYSTPRALYDAAFRLAATAPCGLTTHLAETRAEAEFVARGSGEFAALLAHLGARSPFDQAPGTTPIRYLADIAAWPPGLLLAHVNYPEPGDLDLLRDRGAIVVHCPRSHAFFSHSAHPIEEFLAAGVRVALGTDSLASNGSLSMLDELAYLAVARPRLDRARLFDHATRSAAAEIDGGRGVLEPDGEADIAVLAAPGGAPSSLDEALGAVTDGRACVVATIVDGEVCYVRPGAEEQILVGATRDCR